MIRREVLELTGLFDPTYDRGARPTTTWACGRT